MNRNIKNILWCITGSLFVASCDVMDTKPMESYDESLVWGSKETADAFVYKTYPSTLGLYTDAAATIEAYSPNGVLSNLNNADGFVTETGIDRYTDMGFNRFSALRACNMIIEKAGAATSLTDTQKNELVAEGHFLRGLVFYNQTRWMGRFVPITRVLDASDTDAFKTPLTSSISKSYEIIIDDFKKAAEGLPETSLAGRANKYAAYAFLSRAALQAYAYTKEETFLTECILASNAVIKSPNYALTSDYENMFLSAGDTDKEIILAYYRLDQNTTVSSINDMMGVVPNISNVDVDDCGASPRLKQTNGQTFGGWAIYFPTQDMVDQYLVIDKADGKAKPWSETSQYKNSVTELAATDLRVGDIAKKRADDAKVGPNHNVPDEDDMGSNDKGAKIIRYAKVKDDSKINEIMYENRDKRFYATIVYDSCTWLKDEVVTTCCQGNLWASIRKGQPQSDSWYTTATGYYWKKGVYDVNPVVGEGNKTKYHWVVARLGEMYLNLAEAYLLTKDVTNAVKMLNETRTKHGGLPASVATTEEEAWADYIRERRVEMAYENDSYWSYLRWGKYGGYANHGAAGGAVIKDLETPVHKIQISKDRKLYMIAQVVRNGVWNRKFSTKRYLMPIPQGQIDKRSASGIVDEQNPEW